MNATQSSPVQGSWIQRARPDQSSQRRIASPAGVAADLPPVAPRGGSDKREVWLHRIGLPRRRRKSWPAA
jgi:hypothetical protein